MNSQTEKTVKPFLLDGISTISKLFGENLSSQRNKDKTAAMRKGKPSLWMLAGKTVNAFLRD